MNLLVIRQICASWEPRKFTDDIKAERIGISTELLSSFEEKGKEFIRRRVTGDKYLVLHYDPKKKLRVCGMLSQRIADAKIIQNQNFCRKYYVDCTQEF
jgi:hypothetical protein